MDKQIHYLVTLISLMFLGFLVMKPVTSNFNQEDRVCKLNKGKMDCSHKDVEYRFNDTAKVVIYKFN